MEHLDGLSEARKSLVRLMEEVSFGRIEGLVVRDAEPVLDPPPTIHQLIVIGKPRPQGIPREDTRARRLGEFFSVLDRDRNFMIDELLVDNGLPLRMSVRMPNGGPPPDSKR